MGNILKVTDAILGATDTTTSIIRDHMQKEASLKTTQKKIQLQADINNKLREISTSGNWETWNKDINNFFQQKNDEMRQQDSVYYCKNNLEAEMFDQVLSDSLVNVTNRVALMAMQRQHEQNIVDNNKAKMQLINSGIVGYDFIVQSDALDDAANATGDYTPNQLAGAKKSNVELGVKSLIELLYKDSVEDAINNDETPDSLWEKIKKHAKDNLSILGTRAEGLDMESMYNSHENDIKQQYIAEIKDIQQRNESILADKNVELNQARSNKDILNIKKEGQRLMNGMLGIRLSNSDKNKYSAIFRIDLLDKDGSGSGSGSGGKSDTFEQLIKYAPLAALQSIRNGQAGNLYDAIGMVSSNLQQEWLQGDYKENKDKTEQERKNDYATIYSGRVSPETLSGEVLKLLGDKYPEVAGLMKSEFSALKKDIEKNPKEYGGASLGRLADFLTDAVLGATPDMKDEDILAQFKKHINDCYISKIKYVELDTKGNLKKTFNAGSVRGVSEAARFANEHDFVYTRNGEQWAPGKKEALEAEGGVNSVLMSAVKSTLDIPGSEKLAVKYKLDAEHNDMTSTPIFSYKGNDYEVIPGDNNKSFTVKNLSTGEVIPGKLADKDKMYEERKNEKNAAGENVKTAHQKTVDIKQERADETNKAILNSKTMPKAMQSAGAVKKEEWENSQNDLSSRQPYLRDTISAIDKDAKAVKSKKMSEADFMTKYGISYADWIKNKETTYRFNLILNSN